MTDYQDRTVQYAYDKDGIRQETIYPGGKHVSYAYDELIRLQKVTDGINAAEYQYDYHSRLIEKVFSDGKNTTYSYDDVGRLSTLSHADSEGILDHYKYEYDPAGNKTEIQHNRRGLPEDSGVFGYGYDPLNRLTSVTKDGESLRQYSYDTFGNRVKLQSDKTTTHYSYNALN